MQPFERSTEARILESAHIREDLLSLNIETIFAIKSNENKLR